MSLVTQMLVAEKYGLRLDVGQIAEILGVKKSAVYNRISAGTLGINVYSDVGRTWADYRDVAEYFDQCRERAKVEVARAGPINGTPAR